MATTSTKKLFNRKVNVIVDTVLVSDLRVTFKVKKSLRKEPNTCEVTITNLSSNTRAAMRSKGAVVIVQAGYEGFVEQIFTGDSRIIDHTTENTDGITTIRCGDGEVAYNFDKVSKSYAAGTKISAVISDVVKKLRVDPGNALSAIQGISESFLNGYVSHGRAGAELDRLLTGRGLEWSIQDGRLQLLQVGRTTSVLTVLTADTANTANTGLIGSPQHCTPDKKDGPTFLKVRSLLQPQIKPGGKVRLKSKSIDGLFKVQAVTHEGDTAGGPWYSDLEMTPISE